LLFLQLVMLYFSRRQTSSLNLSCGHLFIFVFFFSSRRRHTRSKRDWSSDVCSSDLVKLVNPTGRVVTVGSVADCGVTGRKLACDTYGGIGRIGGGALSGKDPSKVDRSAAYMARKIARDIVNAGFADRCEVQLAYAIGVTEPVSATVDCFGTEMESLDFITDTIRKGYDLTPRGIVRELELLDVDYNKVSAYGHFGK